MGYLIVIIAISVILITGCAVAIVLNWRSIALRVNRVRKKAKRRAIDRNVEEIRSLMEESSEDLGFFKKIGKSIGKSIYV